MMIFAIFFLGVIVGTICGLLIAVLVAVLNTRFKTPIERTTKQLVSSVKKKGSILEPEEEPAWLKEMPKV